VISGTEVVGLEQEFELLSGEKMTERAEEEEASVFDRFFFGCCCCCCCSAAPLVEFALSAVCQTIENVIL